ncbi:MAG TPA: tetratricopeptide repeat protein, partial [Candidatus Dormibacteraeota bacterium]|nr:tetratricopeptide repeat protein [Candidatus Dormibacteraeota bacterium]
TLLQQVVARLPGNIEAADALGAVLEFEKKYDEAIAVYTPLLQGETESSYVRNRIGTLHLLVGRYQDAIQDFQRAQEIDPADTRSLLSLAQAYQGAGDIDAAMRSYERLIQKEPGNLEARLHRALLWQNEGDTAAALKSYREIIDMANGRGAVTDREASVLVLTYSQIGLVQLDARQYVEAVESFTQALNSAGEPAPELFLLLGRAELEGGKPDEARRVLDEATRRFPDDLDLKVFRGEILITQGDEPGARRYYRSLLSGAGGSVDAYAHVSEVLLRQKRYASADAILKDGLRRHPEDDSLLFARGAATERLGRAAEAERLLAKAIQVNPKNAMALNYLGYMLADRGMRLREALAYIQRALALDPKNAAYLDSLGWVQFRMSRVDEAEKNLRAALQYEADDPSILEHLGDLLMQTGRREEALGAWQRALQHGHEEPDRVRKKILKAQPASRVTP